MFSRICSSSGVAPISRAMTSAFSVDRIRLESSVPALVVDRFDDQTPTNALGGEPTIPPADAAWVGTDYGHMVPGNPAHASD